jgi:hypothetical protein
MTEYHKIQTVFKRDPENKFRTLLEGEYSLPELGYLALNEWVWTEKVDGTNIRIIIEPRTDETRCERMLPFVTFGGRTDNAQIPAFLVTKLNDLFLPFEQKQRLRDMFQDGAVLYGEGYGAKIQKGGGNYRKDQSFVLFDVKVGEWWLQRDDVYDVASKLGLDIVPLFGRGTLLDMVEFVRRGFESDWGHFPAEGLVARPSVELKTRSGHRIITKLKTKDFA